MRSFASAARSRIRPRLRMGVRPPGLLALAGGLLLLGSLSPAHADTVTWTLGADGYWDIASNWSSSPNLPGSTQDVQNNTTFTIEHRFGNDTINSFLSQGAFILSGGTLSVNTTFQVNNTFTMSGGTLANATVNAGTGGQGITVANGGSVLSNVTLNADATFNDSSNLTIQNGFHNASGINFNLGNSSTLYVQGTQTLDNLNVNFTGANSFGYLYANDTLTLGTNFKASGKYGYLYGNNIVNNGTLSADVSGGYWYVQPTTFTNNGTVQAKDGQTVYLYGTEYLGNTGKYDTQGSGAVSLQGALNNTGKTFDVASQVTGTQNFVVQGTILNGTINNSDLLKFNSGTLDGVTLGSGLNLNQTGVNNQVAIQNDFTYPSGATFTMGYNAYVYVHGDRTLDNLNVNFVDPSYYGFIYAYDNLTLGSNFKANGKYGYFQGNNIVNNGTLTEDVANGQWYITPTTFTNNGTLQTTATGSSFNINATNWTNNGLISAQDGTAYLNGTYTLGSGSKFDTSGTGAIWLQGTLDNTGNTFDVASQLSGTQNLIVNGTILNGTLANAQALKFHSATLDGVNLTSDLNLNTAGLSNQVVIQNGFTNTSGININLGNSASLYVHGDRTLDNLNVNFVGDTNYGYIYAYDNLTLGSNFKASGKYGYFQGNNIVNNGTLSADVSGGYWYIQPTTFTNNGTVQAKDGTSVYLYGTEYLGNTGKYDTAGTGTVQLQGTLDNSGKTFDVASQVTGTQNFIVQGTILNGTINNSDLLKFNSGTLDGVTLGSGLNLNQAGVNNNVIIQNGFTYPSGATFTMGYNAYVYVHGDRTFDNLNVNFVDPNYYGFIYAYDNLTLGTNFKANGKYGYFYGNNIVNNGTLTEDVANGQWYVQPTTFTNNGTLQTTASGSTFNINATNWTNNGLISAQDGTAYLNGTYTLGSGSKFDTSGTGAIWLQGTLDNTGSTFDVASQLSGTGNLIVNGTILNGTLANAQSLKVYSATLDGVNLTSDLNLTTAGLANQVVIQNGFTNTSGININLGNSASLSVHGDRTLDNLNVNFVSDSNYGYLYAYDNLTLGSNFKASGKYGYFQGNNIVNNGTLSADVSGGYWQIQPTTFTNNGTVQAKDGETIYLYNTEYLGSTGKYDTQGSGAVSMQGTLVNTGSTFDVASQVTGTRNFVVSGTILNGTINNSDLLKFNGGTLDGVTLGSGLNLNQANVNNQVVIQNGFAYSSGATFTMGYNSYLLVHGDRTLDNLNVNFVDPNYYGFIYAYDNLTLGSNFKASGKYGYFEGNNIVNDGTLSANVAGGNWQIALTTFTNNGTLEAKNGDNIAVSTSAAPTSSGNINVGEGSTVQFSTDLNQTGGTTTVDGDLYLNPGAGGSSLLNLSAGALLGKGTIHGNLTNNGRVQPGSGDASAPAKLSLTGNYTQTTVGILDIRLGSATDFGQLAIGGNAILNGTLDVSLSNGYHPAVGTEFDILTASNVSGTFATTGSLNTGFAYDVTYAPTFVRIKVTNNAVPGPDSLIVLGMGLMGVAARVRRRRK